MLLHRLLALAHQRADRGGRGVEQGDLVLVADLPEAAHVRVAGHALEHQRCRAVGQRAVNHVAVAGDPADVRRAPEHVVLTQVEHGGVGEAGVGQVAAGGVQHALGFAGAARGVEDEQRILGVHALGLAGFRLPFDQAVVPAVAWHLHRHRTPGALHHHDGLHAVGVAVSLQGFVDVGLQRHLLAAAQAFVGGDHQLGLAVGDATGQRLRREAAENDGMDGADAGAGQHGDGGFRDHRQVDGDAVALADTEVAQRVGEAADAGVQVAVADVLGLIRVVAFPEDRGLVAAFLQVAVQAVHGDVQLAVLVPADAEIGEVVADVADGFGEAHPLEALGDLAPVAIRIRDRAGIVRFVPRGGDAVGVGEAFRCRIDVRIHGPSPVFCGRAA